MNLFLRYGVLASAVVDPLAGLSFALRLQTHNGNNVPLGLYQDTACTTPATEDGHLVKGWKGELMGSPVTAIQSDDQFAPMLVFVGDVPTIWLDGVDDYMFSDTITAAQASIFTTTQQDSVDSKQILIQWGVTGADSDNQIHHWVNAGSKMSCFYRDSANADVETAFGTNNTTNWHVFSSVFNGTPQCWVDGAAGVATTSTGTLKQSTAKLGIGAKVTPLGAASEASYWNGSMSAVLVAASAFSAGDRQLVEDYLADIIP